jgi:hypothetical protein
MSDIYGLMKSNALILTLLGDKPMSNRWKAKILTGFYLGETSVILTFILISFDVGI